MYRILDDLFDKHSEPQSVKLRHIVTKSGKKTHKLADHGLWWLDLYIGI